MDSNFRFPDAPSGRSAEARTFSSDREFAPLAWRDRDWRRCGLTLRAMPVAAAVVGNDSMGAVEPDHLAGARAAAFRDLLPTRQCRDGEDTDDSLMTRL